MNTKRAIIVIIALLIILLGIGLIAETRKTSVPMSHFVGYGISFEYPSTYHLTSTDSAELWKQIYLDDGNHASVELYIEDPRSGCFHAYCEFPSKDTVTLNKSIHW